MIAGAFGFVLGSERQLFVDEMLVEEADGLERVLHQPEKHPANPVLAPTLSEEENIVCLHGTVLFDKLDSLFKAWYLSRGGIRYAVSEDGLKWDKPVLNVNSNRGLKGNMVYRGPYGDHRPESFSADGFSVMLDAGASTPETRYKAFTHAAGGALDYREHQRPFLQQMMRGYYTAISPDGFHWQVTPAPVISAKDDPLISDANTCMWDPLENRFVAFTKRHYVSPRTVGDQGTTLRVRGIAFSDDFKAWTRPRTCLVPDDQDPRDMHFYNQCGWTTEGIYIGLVEAYYSYYRNPTMPMKRDIQLISSRDGELWWRAGNRRTFIPLGPEDAWDSHMLDLNAAGPTLVDDKLWFFYGGRDYPHDRHPVFFPWNREGHYAIGLATLRRDGYVSYDAGAEPGALVTRPVRFERGKRLFINADAKDGWIKVEVRRVNEDDAFPGRPRRGIKYRVEDALPHHTEQDAVAVSEDSTRIPVRWKNGDMLPESEEWISLRFILKNASLYSFWAE